MLASMDLTRASDAERERTAQLLQHAVGEGRLDLTDFDERLRAAYAAVTRADLHDVTAGLPAPAPVAVPVRKAAPPDSAWSEQWRTWRRVSVLLLVIWALTSIASGGLTFFWPVFPIGGWGAAMFLSMVAGRRPGHGCGGGTLPSAHHPH